jgi:2-oxoglutarate ferredoxin oxidoreductase subunit beta
MNTIKKLEMKNPIAVSGIGCAGRSSGYFDFASVNTLHGRAIPIAEGIKRADENLDVFVLSGDGDLLSIGLNHLLHCARRNTNLTVICSNNHVYGMTGGQASPTTAIGEITKTTPKGAEFEPMDAQKLIASNKKFFYARTNPFNQKHLADCLEKAFNHKGFAFVEVKSACITEWMRKGKIKTVQEATKFFIESHDYVEGNRELKDNEYGIYKND